MRTLFLLATMLISEIALASPVVNNSCLISGSESKRSENLLAALTQVPTPAFYALDQKGKTRFVPPAKVFADVLKIGDKSLILNSLEELRFLSQTLAKSEILLVLTNEGVRDFSEDKLSRVLSVARLMQIKMNVVWIAEEPMPKLVKDLAQQSGGSNFETRDLVQRANDFCQESIASR